MKRHERVFRGRVNSEHLVQLFDGPESRADATVRFLLEGWRRDEPLLVAARPANWTLMARALEAAGCPVEHATNEGRLVVLDASAALSKFTVNGEPVPQRFAASIGQVVDRLSTRFGRRLRVYGEMVDLLAAQGDFRSAQRLEQLWNELSARYSISLLCGYTATHFGDPRDGWAVHAICDEHDHVHASPGDLLASWLVSRHTRVIYRAR